MKILYKYMAFIAVFSLLLSSCTKDETVQGSADVPSDVASLYLGPNLGDYYNQTRQQEQDIPECSEDAPAFAQIRLEYGDDNTVVETIVGISSDEQGLFTEYSDDLEIPIPSGETTVSVTLTDFVVWTDDGGAPGEVIWVAPKEGSEYAMFVDGPLDQTFSLRAGSKNYVNVDVICFDDREVNLYGYQFFDITPVPLYEFCIFANYCTDSGRHYTANYSFSLYEYDGNREDGKGEMIYEGLSPETGETDGTYWADPLCVVIPGPGEGIASDVPYLVFEANLEDWVPYYTAEDDDESMISMTLSWDMIQMLFDEDGDDETTEYYHIFFNCGPNDEPLCDLDDDEADCDGDGIPNGQDECPEVAPDVDEDGDGCEDVTQCDDSDPEADCDGDGTPNKCDMDNPNYPTFDCDGDGVNNGDDDCPEFAPEVDEDGDGCEDVTQCDDSDPEADCDGDGTPNKCDMDNPNYPTFDCDGDGVLNGDDDCPEFAPDVDEDGDGCEDVTQCDDSDPEADCDGDGTPNKCDMDNPNYPTFDCDGDGVVNGDDNCPEVAPDVDEDGDGCEDETGGEPCLPDPDTSLSCETAVFNGDISNNFPVDLMLNGSSIGNLTFDVADGDIIVGVALTVVGGYLIDDVEISIDNEIVCYDETDYPGGGSYELDGASDFSYTLNDITVRLNVCPATE